MLKIKVISFFLCLAVLAGTIIGCTSSEDALPSSQGRQQVTVTDLAEREVTLQAPVDQVVLQASGSGGAFMTLLALEGKELPGKIAGWDPGLPANRHWEWQKLSEAMPELREVANVGVMGSDTFSIEQVVSLKPDVLIIPLSTYEGNKETVQQLESLGVPVVVIDYHSQMVEHHLASIKLLGEMMGKQSRAKEIMDFYKEETDIVFSRLQSIPEHDKPTVYVELGSQGPTVFGNSYGNTLWGGIIEQSGGANIARGVVVETGGSPLNPEYVLQQNPSIVMITGAYWPGVIGSMRLGYYATNQESVSLLQSYTSRPGWENLNAVKHNRIYSIHHILARDVMDAASYQFLAKTFYPERFEDIDPEDTLRRFHERFLPIEYSGVFMIGIEEE